MSHDWRQPTDDGEDESQNRVPSQPLWIRVVAALAILAMLALVVAQVL